MRSRALIALLLIIVLSGCGLISPEPEMNPQEVTTKFYRWYIGYPGNPLVDREYRESPYLADSFIKKVDELTAGSLIADPILLAQDIPERFTVQSPQDNSAEDKTEISSGQAAVIVNFYWSGNPTPSKRLVDLKLIDGEWKITKVSMVEP